MHIRNQTKFFPFVTTKLKTILYKAMPIQQLSLNFNNYLLELHMFRKIINRKVFQQRYNTSNKQTNNKTKTKMKMIIGVS